MVIIGLKERKKIVLSYFFYWIALQTQTHEKKRPWGTNCLQLTSQPQNPNYGFDLPEVSSLSCDKISCWNRYAVISNHFLFFWWFQTEWLVCKSDGAAERWNNSQMTKKIFFFNRLAVEKRKWGFPPLPLYPWENRPADLNLTPDYQQIRSVLIPALKRATFWHKQIISQPP